MESISWPELAVFIFPKFITLKRQSSMPLSMASTLMVKSAFV